MDPAQDFKNSTEKTISSLKEDLRSVRTGRATPALLEGLIIEAYGGQAKLKLPELASITTDGPTTLVIVPFDPSITQDIEKAVLKSSLGLSPQVQGTRILIRIPPLSEEQRGKFIKLVGEKIEERKVSIRGNRDEVRKKIRQSEESGDITEDDKFRMEKEIDNLTQKYMEEIQMIKERKEEEIRQV